jgi:hypothetical protein
MALEKFRAPPLPNPPSEYDPQFFRQLIRTLELYFSQLDSRTPNLAQSYRADEFVGGYFTGAFQNLTTAEKTASTAVAGQVVFDTDLAKLCVYTGATWETITSV